MILDLAGEMFTDAGRTYLMRRLAEEGIGPINYVAWRYEYIFHCNQLAYFNTGRMYAYLMLEREWPRVKPYTDLAYRDAIDNLETVIEPDGGSLEGPGYLNPIIRENYNALKLLCPRPRLEALRTHPRHCAAYRRLRGRCCQHDVR